jgi:hypothetical protein
MMYWSDEEPIEKNDMSYCDSFTKEGFQYMTYV